MDFKKEGISLEQQVQINGEISDLVNEKKEDEAILSYLKNNHDFTSEEARQELDKAKMWMGWYARKDNHN